MSGVISTPFSFDHAAATFRRSSSSWLMVARRASQVSQSSPQYAINAFMEALSLATATLHGDGAAHSP
jgi:hypothetical protein